MPEEYLFLEEDLTSLKGEIMRLQNESREMGREAGLFANQSSETWHDNFGYEEAQRQQKQFGARIDSLMQIYTNAHITPWPGLVERVAVGHTVTVKNVETGEEKILRIGSHITIGADASVIPYSSPMGKAILGRSKGDVATVYLPVGERKFKILDIEL
jgi:transcription elongation factor GreA